MDREKQRQKLKESYSKKDVSYLKDKVLESYTSGIPSLPENLKDILKQAYNMQDAVSLSFLEKYFSHNAKTSYKMTETRVTTPLNSLSLISSSAPTSRQEALNLSQWLDDTENKYIPTFYKLINSSENFDRELLLKLWKGVYVVAMKELQKQVSVQCIERGELLSRVFTSYSRVFEFSDKKLEKELWIYKEKCEKQISEIAETSSAELTLMQNKLDKLEKEKEEWRHSKAEIIVLTKKLLEYLEKLRKYEDKVKKVKGREKYFEEYEKLVNSIAAQEDKQNFTLQIDPLFQEKIGEKLKKIASLTLEVKQKEQALHEINSQITEKECLLSTLNFEIELKEGMKFKKKYEYRSKDESSPEKKYYIPIFKADFEEEKQHCESFFKVLRNKSVDRLIKKAKVSQEHIFKSLSVIYSRAAVQLNAFGMQNISIFRFLIYKQFSKYEDFKNCEKNLKRFLSGCLKFITFRRVKVFLKLLGLGDWVESYSYSNKSFLLYLSMYLYMQNSAIGLVIINDLSRPIQYYPTSRALFCLLDLKSIFSQRKIVELQENVRKISTPDPKNVNPEGMVELEAFFEAVLNEHEEMLSEIRDNCEEFFKISERFLSKNDFEMLVSSLIDSFKYQEIENDIKKLSEKVPVDAAIDLASKYYILSDENLKNYIPEFMNLSLEDAINLIKSKETRSELYINLVERIENLNILHGLVWMKILTKSN